MFVEAGSRTSCRLRQSTNGLTHEVLDQLHFLPTPSLRFLESQSLADLNFLHRPLANQKCLHPILIRETNDDALIHSVNAEADGTSLPLATTEKPHQLPNQPKHSSSIHAAHVELSNQFKPPCQTSTSENGPGRSSTSSR